MRWSRSICMSRGDQFRRFVHIHAVFLRERDDFFGDDPFAFGDDARCGVGLGVCQRDSALLRESFFTGTSAIVALFIDADGSDAQASIEHLLITASPLPFASTCAFPACRQRWPERVAVLAAEFAH